MGPPFILLSSQFLFLPNKRNLQLLFSIPLSSISLIPNKGLELIGKLIIKIKLKCTFHPLSFKCSDFGLVLKKIKILPLNFTKRCKAYEKTPHVSKQKAEIATFCKDKGLKALIFLTIEGHMNIFS